MCWLFGILTKKSVSWYLTNFTIIWLTLLSYQVHGKPEDIFGNIATGAMLVISESANIIQKGGAIRKDHGVELPFAKAHSKTEAGAGEAMMQRKYSESSEEDDDKRRRKRSLDFLMPDLIGEESLLPLPPHNHMHHILKRSPCHYGTGSTGGGGTNAGTGTGGVDIPGDGDIDAVERRRRARLRKAKAAAARKRKAKSSKSTRKSTRKTKKSYLVSDADQTAPALTRRKRQSEQDDLNANAGKDISQHLQQLTEKVRNIWENIMNSMNQMVQNIHTKFSSNNPAAEEI